MKKILIAALWLPLIAFAQNYPSPTFKNVTVQGTLSVSGAPVFTTPVPTASGGLGANNGTATGVPVFSAGTATVTAVTGSGAPVLGTSPSIATPTITGSLTATGLVTTTDLASQAANTILANATASAASPTAFVMPSCSTASSALNYTSGTGIGCNSAINAATLGGATFSAPGAIGGGTAAAGTFTALTATSSFSAPYTAPNASPSSQTIQQQLNKIPVSCEDYSGGCTTANIVQAMTDAASTGRCFQFNGTYTTTGPVTLNALSSNLCITGRGGLKGPASGSNTAVLEIKNFGGVTVDGNVTLDCNSNAYTGAALKVWSSASLTPVQYQNFNFSEYANCRQAIIVGDPTQSTLPVSEITFSRGFMYNVAQGMRVYSSQAVVNSNGLMNIVDPHSSGNWAISFTGTCSGTTLTVTGINANGYLDQYDVLSGTGITAGTYITGQNSGTLGSNGSYSVSQSCTSSSAAITSEVRGINYWTTGGTVSINGGETVNSVVSNGILCVEDIMASPNSYGNCNFTGGVIESGGLIAETFNPSAIVSPNGGGIQLSGVRGDVGGTTSTNLIVTDSTFPGNVTISGNRIFGVAARSGYNIVGGSSATSIYFDLSSFGTNMLQGYNGVSGGTAYMVGPDGQQGATVVSGNATQSPNDTMVVFACAATCTYTMLDPTKYPGRELKFSNAAAQAVNSASSNIQTTSGSSTSSIFPAALGKFITLRADATAGVWRTTSNN